MIDPPDPGAPRRSPRPLPSHRYLPPLPAAEPTSVHPRELGWEPVADFDWACDLFDHRHYWEAHEVWEAEWREVPRGSADANLLQGLICAAAFTIKRHQGLRDAATRLLARTTSLLAPLAGPVTREVDVAVLLASLRSYDEGGPWPLSPRR